MKNLSPFKILSVSCIGLLVTSTNSYAYENESENNWDVSIGIGAMFDSKYEGSDNTEVEAMPYIDIEWNDLVFLNPGDGLGVHLYDRDDLTVDLSVGYEEGRKESDDRKNLQGLGNIDGAATANLNMEYELGPISPYIGISQHLGGTDGIEAEIGIESMIPFAALAGDISFDDDMGDDNEELEGAALMFGVSATWADDNYMEGFFGVNSIRSSNSGLSQYTATSGFKSVDTEIGVMYPIDENWSFNVQAGYSQLIGDAADSPIVKDEGQVFGGAFISYRF